MLIQKHKITNENQPFEKIASFIDKAKKFMVEFEQDSGHDDYETYCDFFTALNGITNLYMPTIDLFSDYDFYIRFKESGEALLTIEVEKNKCLYKKYTDMNKLASEVADLFIKHTDAIPNEMADDYDLDEFHIRDVYILFTEDYTDIVNGYYPRDLAECSTVTTFMKTIKQNIYSKNKDQS
ncbi:MAG: hypothetical protein JKY19_06500 [Alcanivoracaceae bacterium]|nr:hypothetical protein [Alcanivoracaceae bacterium]